MKLNLLNTNLSSRFLKLTVSLVFAAVIALPAAYTSALQNDPPAEAPAGFDGLTNGMVSQEQFDADRARFEQREVPASGLGPVFSMATCSGCHFNPVSGGISQVAGLRAGHWDGDSFREHPGGSLIQSSAIDASLQERVLEGNEVRALRTSLNTLGDGFVEAIGDETLIAIAERQPIESKGRIAGEIVRVPVLEAGGALRIGRFGWKNQHASLVSFSADSYLNEMGITSPLFPVENTSNGASVAAFDIVPDPEDNGDSIEAFARFIRATKAPPRDEFVAATDEARAGVSLFNSIGCAVCHTPTITTAPPGTLNNGGAFTVPPSLGSKVIHPFSDFLLHDVGTGDGIVQNGGASTRNKLRTPPLWGVRTRNRLMHDGLSLTFNEAILRHGGEASYIINNYRRLSGVQRDQLLTFLKSL